MDYLQSKKGTIKTVEEWQAECIRDYEAVRVSLPDQWVRYQRLLELKRVGDKRD